MDSRDWNSKSRKELMVIAIDKQMQNFKKQNINKKIGIITFGIDVAIIGDGSKETINIKGKQSE